MEQLQTFLSLAALPCHRRQILIPVVIVAWWYIRIFAWRNIVHGVRRRLRLLRRIACETGSCAAGGIGLGSCSGRGCGCD